jgi:hypothetical protein
VVAGDVATAGEAILREAHLDQLWFDAVNVQHQKVQLLMLVWVTVG